MKMGTRSLIVGAHCLPIHTLLVALAWWKLFGFPWDPRLWAAFLLHDIGYFGSPEMDGPVGQRHPELGARIMGWLFGPEWASFTIRHSRTYVELEGLEVSALCAADKLAAALDPYWLYIFRIWITGEWCEYVAVNVSKGLCKPDDLHGWAAMVRAYCRDSSYALADKLKQQSLALVPVRIETER